MEDKRNRRRMITIHVKSFGSIRDGIAHENEETGMSEVSSFIGGRFIVYVFVTAESFNGDSSRRRPVGIHEGSVDAYTTRLASLYDGIKRSELADTLGDFICSE